MCVCLRVCLCVCASVCLSVYLSLSLSLSLPLSLSLSLSKMLIMLILLTSHYKSTIVCEGASKQFTDYRVPDLNFLEPHLCIVIIF